MFNSLSNVIKFWFRYYFFLLFEYRIPLPFFTQLELKDLNHLFGLLFLLISQH